jgi:hypothetical protein
MAENKAQSLYSIMCDAYREWEQKPRPTEKVFKTSFVRASYLDEAGAFRRQEWEAYIKARDAYFDRQAGLK